MDVYNFFLAALAQKETEKVSQLIAPAPTVLALVNIYEANLNYLSSKKESASLMFTATGSLFELKSAVARFTTPAMLEPVTIPRALKVD